MCAHHLPSTGEWGIAFVIRKAVMDAVRRDPEDGAAFEGERGADRQEIFHPLGSFVAAMREQAVVAHADAEAAGNPPQEKRQKKRLPGEEEQGGNRAQMKQNHDGRREPVHTVGVRLLLLQTFGWHWMGWVPGGFNRWLA